MLGRMQGRSMLRPYVPVTHWPEGRTGVLGLASEGVLRLLSGWWANFIRLSVGLHSFGRHEKCR